MGELEIVGESAGPHPSQHMMETPVISTEDGEGREGEREGGREGGNGLQQIIGEGERSQTWLVKHTRERNLHEIMEE